MPKQIDLERLLSELATKEHEKIGAMIQAALQNDMTKIHMALGGMFACQELGRFWKARVEGLERIEQEKEQQRRARALRQRQRELRRATAPATEVAA